MGKKALCLIFAFLLSINSFAAVVSDDDGSAFITKGKVDSLKNDFQSQIDNYNTSIDNKIDAAIASYLAGVKVSKQQDRSLLCDANSWTMYSTVDYPKYTEGYPYIEGSSVIGHAHMSSLWGTHNVTWSGFVFPGVVAYKTNGGFRKHYIDGIFQKNNQIGGNRYYGEYKGYYIDEGEYIHVGGYTANMPSSSTWAHIWERTLTPYQANDFANLSVPATAWGQFCHFVSTEDQAEKSTMGGSTTLNIVVQAAERINGKLSVNNDVAIYSDISDSRFYNMTTSNKIGISTCSPQIAKGGYRTDFVPWFNIACAGVNVKYGVWRAQRANTGDTITGAKWTLNNYPAWGLWEYDLIVDTTHFDNRYQSYLKLANDPNNFQFKYLWAPHTNAAAIKANDMLIDTSVKDSIKSNIRNVLIYDNNSNPHLSMIAGFPFLEVKKDEIVSWDFTYEGTSNAVLLGKYGPFIVSGDPSTQADVLFETISGSTKTYNTVFQAEPGKTNTIKFKATEDGIIFLKWTKNGGGTIKLNTSNMAKVEKEE